MTLRVTLNGHFVLKSFSGSASNGLAFCLPGQTVLKFADLCIGPIGLLSAAKSVAQGL